MSYTRVMVLESSVPWSKVMRAIKKDGEPVLKAQVKAGNLKRWSLVRTGEHAGFLISKLDTKAKMNKYAKTLAAVRRDVEAETGQQSWIYSGSVKASS